VGAEIPNGSNVHQSVALSQLDRVSWRELRSCAIGCGSCAARVVPLPVRG
jgi:hypothetical protein